MAGNPLNIIVICLDTLRSDMISHTGVDWIQTPNMDALARESVVFENAYGEGQPTLQMRRCLFTGMRSFPFTYECDNEGLWPWNSSIAWSKIPPENPTLAEILLDRGYVTGLMSDTYHMFKPTANFTRGFASCEFVRGQESDNYRTCSLDRIDWRRRVKEKDPDPHRHAMVIQYLMNMEERHSEEDWTAAQVFRSATNWLQSQAENKPFFLWIDSFDPHEPWDPPRRYADLYAPGWVGPDLLGYPDQDALTEEERARIKALYCGEVTFVDKLIGDLMNTVSDAGLLDDTVIVLLSDHGTQLLDHGRFGKGGSFGGANLHWFNTKLNWMVRLPGSPLREKRVKPFVQSHDIFPTLLDLLGVPHSPVDGRSAWPLVGGRVDRLHDYTVTGWMMGAAVRDERWNYTCAYADEDLRERLFDTVTDPDEKVDVVADHPDVVRLQRRRLEDQLGASVPAPLFADMRGTPAPVNRWLQARLP